MFSWIKTYQNKEFYSNLAYCEAALFEIPYIFASNSDLLSWYCVGLETQLHWSFSSPFFFQFIYLNSGTKSLFHCLKACSPSIFSNLHPHGSLRQIRTVSVFKFGVRVINEEESFVSLLQDTLSATSRVYRDSCVQLTNPHSSRSLKLAPRQYTSFLYSPISASAWHEMLSCWFFRKKVSARQACFVKDCQHSIEGGAQLSRM